MYREATLGRVIWFYLYHIFVTDCVRTIKASFGLPTDGLKVQASMSGLISSRDIALLSGRMNNG